MSKRAIFACSVATLALGLAPAVLAKSSGRIPRTPPSASQLAPTTLHPEAGRGLGRSYTGNGVDVTQFHYDAGRTGWNPTETDLTPATVKSRSFGLLASFAVDDNVFAQPLLVTNYEMPNGALHDVLVIATGNNSVYAFDAHSYELLYKVNLGKQQASVDVDCDDVMPGYGITGTPVIVREGERATIYLVSATEPRPNEFHHRLHALDLGTGKDMRAPAEIAPSARFTDGTTNMFDPRNQWSRTGVAVSGKSLYFGVSSHCDNKSTAVTGWILRYGLDLKPEGAFNTIGSPGEELASVWMTGFAPAIDARGDVWVATGNGPYGPGRA